MSTPKYMLVSRPRAGLDWTPVDYSPNMLGDEDLLVATAYRLQRALRRDKPKCETEYAVAKITEIILP